MFSYEVLKVLLIVVMRCSPLLTKCHQHLKILLKCLWNTVSIICTIIVNTDHSVTHLLKFADVLFHLSHYFAIFQLPIWFWFALLYFKQSKTFNSFSCECIFNTFPLSRISLNVAMETWADSASMCVYVTTSSGVWDQCTVPIPNANNTPQPTK